jgi:hypothetical protein
LSSPYATILDKALGYMDGSIKKVIEVRLHPRNFRRVRDFGQSASQPASQPCHLVTNIVK